MGVEIAILLHKQLLFRLVTARLSRNLDVSNCLQWAELSGRLWTVNRRIKHSGKNVGSSFSLLSSQLFQDIPHKTDNTKPDSESIIRPIYQLGSLHSINTHITALSMLYPLRYRLNIQSGNQGKKKKPHQSGTSVILSLSQSSLS